MTKKQDHLPSERNAKLEKALAEATRELEIEAVLEKVRSRSLAMHKSDELHEVVMLLAEKLKELNVNLEGAVICLPVDDNRGRGLTMWAAMAAQAYAPPLFVPFGHPYITSFSEAWKTGIDFASQSWGYEEKTGFWKWAFEHSDFRYIPEGRKEQILAAPAYALSTAFSKHSAITIPSHKGQMLSEDEGAILKRFAKVFDQAYVRFLDLQKAEAQAREAQIEVALERTRTQSMLMQHSIELDDTLRVFHQQVLQLGIQSAFSFLWLPDEDKNRHIFWAAWAENNSKNFKSKAIDYPLDRNEPATAQCLIDWKGKEPVVSYHVPPEGVEGYFAAWQELIDGVEQLTSEHFKGGLHYVEAFMKYGCFGVMVEDPLSPEEEKILARFAVEFERTYTRFLDLQKAEEQAREAQIETALERVRSRTMGMQHTEELREVIQVIYQQLVHLGFEINNAGILTDFRETDDFNLWMADPYTTFPTRIIVPYIDHPQMNCFKEGKAKGLDFLTYSLTFEEKNKWFEYCFPILAVPEEAQHIVFDSSGLATSAALLKNVSLYLINFSGVPYSDADNAILMRFGKVFEQTYTRFKDLEQAEEQARESQIQLALERVRARTMAMQRSDELKDAAAILFKQVEELGVSTWTSGFQLWDEDRKTVTVWTCTAGVVQQAFRLPVSKEDFFMLHVIEADRNGEALYVEELSGNSLENHYSYMASLPGLADNFKSLSDEGIALPQSQVNHAAFFTYGYLLFITYHPIPGAHDIFKRFAAVFEQTYTRFLDLQKAEAQARESQIQLALERVRARTMAMQHSDELAETVYILFQQFKDLGENPDQATIGIINEEEGVIEYWVTMHGNQENRVFKFSLDEPNVTRKIYEAWKAHKKSLVIDLSGKALHDFMTYRASKGGAPAKKTEKRRIINVALFSKGLLNVQSTIERSEESIRLLERFAQVFEGTYTRFLDLKKAEEQAREGQIELSLERLRAKTMAMHTSEHVGETVATMFDELVKLGIDSTARCGIAIVGDDREMELWRASYNSKGEVEMLVGRVDMTIHPLLEEVYQAWKNKQISHSYELTGQDQENYFRALNNSPDYAAQFDLAALPAKQINSDFFFPEGCVYAFTINPLSEDEARLFKRFAGVFGLTYRRYLDLQKAENQAKESQIQLALERVRARTMAMQKSDELAETATVLFQQLLNLGISSERAFIAIPNDDTHKFELWGAQEGGNQMSARLEYEADATYAFREIYKAWQEKRSELTVILKGKNLEEHVNYARKVLHMPVLPGLVQEQRILYNAFFSKGLLMIVTPDTQPKETLEILERFAAVFDGTYTRFLDLQKSETQGRESQIQLGLERVRAKAMAMQNSEELNDLIGTVFGELTKLDFVLTRCLIMIFDPETKASRWWMANSEAPAEPMNYLVQNHKNPAYDAYLKAWKERHLKWRYLLKGKVKKDWDKFLFADTELVQLPAPVIAGMKAPEQVLLSASFNNFGCLTLVTLEPLSDEHSDIMLRFAKVFDMSYTRFNDLKQAETQARESQIQLALERVRARTMAMQKSDELAEVIQLIYDQLCQLNFNIDNANFVVNYKESDDLDLWLAVSGQQYSTKMHIPYLDHPIFNRLNEAKVKGLSFFSDSLTFEEKNTFFQHLFENAPEIPQERKKAVFNGPGYARSVVFMKTIALSIQNYAAIPYSDAENAVLARFGKVFEQTYTRFNDLQLAEAQAREATIEAALERVRGRAMAMHISEDLTATASAVFRELKKLGIKPVRCGVGLIDKETYDTALYAATGSEGEENLELMGRVTVSGHPVLAGIYKHWVENKDYFPELHGKSLKTYYEQLQIGFKVPDWQHGKKMHGHFIPFSEGCLYAWAGEPLGAQDVKILKRFTSVIDLTFKRYMELQRSEANARDAIREASLDRVRAEIASMRTPKDLERITPLMCEELATLGIPFIRCGVFIIDEKRELIHTYLSTPDGRALAAFDLAFDSDGIGRDVLPAWRKKQIALVHWDEEEFATYTKNLVTQGTVNPGERYVTEHPDTSLDLHFLPFLQGMLYVGNVAPLLESELSVVQSLAAAFSTAYARYEDFNRLEAAKEQVDNALTELKAAQNKLIQSEKMASLGELTAGIAHEIQNPLNFVNNFSEVNQEMIDELKEELEAGNIGDALAIAADIKQNEEKINHHGKRADAIVKGMLEHSRAGTGEKQLSNINVLADEFLKLSYHGLRAKDKTFNAEMITHFDKNLPKVNVVQQDIGRVLINLFNNAFYAVNQKAKTAGPDYKPAVEVSTSTKDGAIVIKVKDNGNGIPDAIKDKIMQPFFTTKPTGEGTGLGLSLSYDIVVKGHGGSINVDTKEGEFTEFTIQIPLNQ